MAIIMKKYRLYFQLFITVLIFLSINGCHTEPPLTKEEITAYKRYHLEPTEDKEYYFKTAGFAVRPPPETPFVQSYVKIRTADGIEFTEGENLREPRFYVGRLSTYFYKSGPYDSLNTAVSNLKALVENSQSSCAIKVLDDSLTTDGVYSIHKFRWVLVNGNPAPFVDRGHSDRRSKDVLMIGAIIETDKGTYLVTLVENDTPNAKFRGSESCREGWDVISVKEATAMMERRFQQFLHGIRFDVD